MDTLAPFILVGGMPWLDDASNQDEGALKQTKNVGIDNTPFLDIGTSYHGVEMDPTGEVGMGSTTVTMWGSQLCLNAQAGVLRCFELDPGTSLPADVRFASLRRSATARRSLT